jgi:hypothetical protein
MVPFYKLWKNKRTTMVIISKIILHSINTNKNSQKFIHIRRKSLFNEKRPGYNTSTEIADL